jgi:hypothetical protein
MLPTRITGSSPPHRPAHGRKPNLNDVAAQLFARSISGPPQMQDLGAPVASAYTVRFTPSTQKVLAVPVLRTVQPYSVR